MELILFYPWRNVRRSKLVIPSKNGVSDVNLLLRADAATLMSFSCHLRPISGIRCFDQEYVLPVAISSYSSLLKDIRVLLVSYLLVFIPPSGIKVAAGVHSSVFTLESFSRCPYPDRLTVGAFVLR